MKDNSLNLRDNQREKLIEIGSRLQQARQQQSISLEQLAVQTRIQGRLLKAIEEGNLEQLPEPIYIRGFIQRFANSLGLNGSELASSFPSSSMSTFIKPSWQKFSGGIELKPIHLYLAYVFVVICAVNSLSYIVNRSAIQANSPQKDEQLQEQKLPKGEQSPSEASEKLAMFGPVSVNTLSKTGKPVRVDVTMKSQSWIRVVADGKKQFEGQLPKGTQLTWMADEQLTVKAGNAGGVLVAFNEEKAKKLGAPGKTQEITFVANAKY